MLTLGTVSEDGPYCASCFYAFDPERLLLIFTSSPSTRHGMEMERNPRVSMNIALETRIVGKIEGVQMTGNARRADGKAKTAYLRRFPFALAADLDLWAVEPDFIKLTDNRLGFGKKLIWRKEE